MSVKADHPLLPRIRELRGQGLSMAAIGRQLGKTKNSIVGICKRAGLSHPDNNPVGPGANRGAANGNHRWSTDEEATLLRLVGENLTDGEIAAAMSRNPGQVAMRLHQLRLRGMAVPQRSCQTRGKSRSLAVVQPVAPKGRPAPLPSGLTTDLMVVSPQRSRAVTYPAAQPTPPAGRVPPSLPRAIFSGGAARCCQWPLGHPREPGFRFCEAPLPIGAPSSYCPAHHAIAYVGRSSRSEEVA